MKMRAVLVSVLLGLVALVACSEGGNGSTFPAEVTADAASDGPQGRECCDALCLSSFETSFAVDAEDTRLRGSKLSLCRNGACIETDLADVVPDAGSTAGSKVFPGGNSWAPGTGTLTVLRDEPRRIRVGLVVGNDYEDGDRYEVKLTDADGSELYRRESAVSYVVRSFCCQICGNATFDEPDGGADGGDAGDAGDGGR